MCLKAVQRCRWYFNMNTLSSPDIPRSFPYIINCRNCSFSLFVADVTPATCLCSRVFAPLFSQEVNLLEVTCPNAHDFLMSPFSAMTLCFGLLWGWQTIHQAGGGELCFFWVFCFFPNFPSRSLCCTSGHTGNDYRFPAALNLAP